MKKLILGFILLIAFNTSVKASDYVLINNNQKINILADSLINLLDSKKTYSLLAYDGCFKTAESYFDGCNFITVYDKFNYLTKKCERYEERQYIGGPECQRGQTTPNNPECDYDIHGNILGCSAGSGPPNNAYPGECWLDENDVQHCD